jgi:hypothetical protein
MRPFTFAHRLRTVGFTTLLMTAALTTGCRTINSGAHAVPAARIDPNLFGESKEGQMPIVFTALGQKKPPAHVVDAGDTLAVYIHGVLPASVDDTPVLEQFQSLNQVYYPPGGTILRPATGLPVTVNPDGTVELPLVGMVNVSGLTLVEVSEKIREVYRGQEIIQANRERVSVSLVTPRVKRIVVLRQDTPNPSAALTPPGVVEQIHRGSASIVDLPAYENDVLHALAYTGGLPGTDAVEEAWVMKSTCFVPNDSMDSETMKRVLEQCREAGHKVTRIPLRGQAGCALPFKPEDVILEEGDVLFIPRRNEYFYTGGMLGGAKIPLPYNDDLDVIEAIALATNSVGGPLGQSGAALQGNANPGYVFKPTRALVLRKMPDGSQIQIRVDLARAMRDPKERLIIRHGDLLVLSCKPLAATANVFFNTINVNGFFVD